MKPLKFLPLILLILLVSCQQEETYLPKPRGYFRIELPAHEYQALNKKAPYNFEHSIHTKIINDPHFLAQEYWIEMKYPQFDAEVDISYKPIRQSMDSLIGYVNTSHKLTRKHGVRATKIDEYKTTAGRDKSYDAVVFELEGDVPSYFHWYAHDSTNHFVRAALYFNTAEKGDSLKPIIEYIKLDMMHMLNTLEFKEPK